MKRKNRLNVELPALAFITGASSGIGKEYAIQLANQGINLVISARREARLVELKNQLEDTYNIEVEVFLADLSRLEDIERMTAYIRERPVDILINNAGFGTVGDFANADLEQEVAMIHVHNIAPVYFCRAALEGMVARNRGFIINVSSVASYVTLPGAGMYGATKAFLRNFSISLGKEFKGSNIRVQALLPGFTHTEFHQGEKLSELKSSLPKFLFMDAEELVRKSLRALNRKKVVCTPKLINKILRFLLRSPLFSGIAHKIASGKQL